jgi:hypothetical protein
MKIAPLFSVESPMSVALTTTYENGIFGGVSLRFLRLHVRKNPLPQLFLTKQVEEKRAFSTSNSC